MTRNLLSLVKSAIALAESLNFSRAAHARHISQPTLTKHISALEDWVGVPLFERDRQVVAIKDAGRAFIEEARLSRFTLTDLYKRRVPSAESRNGTQYRAELLGRSLPR